MLSKTKEEEDREAELQNMLEEKEIQGGDQLMEEEGDELLTRQVRKEVDRRSKEGRG